MRWAVAAIMLLAGVPATAQQRTADDYVCLLAGACPTTATPPAATSRSFKVARPPAPAEMTATNTSNRFALATPPTGPVDLRLSFESGSAALTASARAEARTLAAALVRPQLASRRVRIEGHTDSVGGRAPNLSLSQRRAASVVAYLASQGVARSRLVAVGYGYDRPLPGKTARDPANRRVIAALIP